MSSPTWHCSAVGLIQDGTQGSRGNVWFSQCITKKIPRVFRHAGFACSVVESDEVLRQEIIPCRIDHIEQLLPPKNLSQFLAER